MAMKIKMFEGSFVLYCLALFHFQKAGFALARRQSLEEKDIEFLFMTLFGKRRVEMVSLLTTQKIKSFLEWKGRASKLVYRSQRNYC